MRNLVFGVLTMPMIWQHKDEDDDGDKAELEGQDEDEDEYEGADKGDL